jgi:hypothetical protein
MCADVPPSPLQSVLLDTGSTFVKGRQRQAISRQQQGRGEPQRLQQYTVHNCAAAAEQDSIRVLKGWPCNAHVANGCHYEPLRVNVKGSSTPGVRTAAAL